jgi:ACT domain-containing protein
MRRLTTLLIYDMSCHMSEYITKARREENNILAIDQEIECPGHGTIPNIPDDLSALKESISYLNASSRNFEDNSFSVELFVDK